MAPAPASVLREVLYDLSFKLQANTAVSASDATRWTGQVRSADLAWPMAFDVCTKAVSCSTGGLKEAAEECECRDKGGWSTTRLLSELGMVHAGPRIQPSQHWRPL